MFYSLFGVSKHAPKFRPWGAARYPIWRTKVWRKPGIVVFDHLANAIFHQESDSSTPRARAIKLGEELQMSGRVEQELQLGGLGVDLDMKPGDERADHELHSLDICEASISSESVRVTNIARESRMLTNSIPERVGVVQDGADRAFGRVG